MQRVQVAKQQAAAKGEIASIAASTLDVLSRAAERAQKIARLALGLPTELMAHAEEAEKRRFAMEAEAGRFGGAAAERVIDRLAELEGEDFLRAIDSITGPTPAGSGKVIDIKALREKAG